jgi:hypothetical protein
VCDNIIRKINDGTYDPYNVLSSYRAFLQDKGSISAITLKQQVITIKNFLEYSDIDISPRKFKPHGFESFTINEMGVASQD